MVWYPKAKLGDNLNLFESAEWWCFVQMLRDLVVITGGKGETVAYLSVVLCVW